MAGESLLHEEAVNGGRCKRLIAYTFIRRHFCTMGSFNALYSARTPMAEEKQGEDARGCGGGRREREIRKGIRLGKELD